MSKVLIIEDERPLRAALVEKFTHEGFEVFQAGDGAEGLATALLEHPDLIMLDLLMPKMDGLTMLRKLREDKWGVNAKVIILTNLERTDALGVALEESTFFYMIKSDWKLEEIVKMAKERIKERLKK